MQVHLSKSQIGLLTAGVILSGLTAFSGASRGGLMAFDSRGLLAEVIGSGYQKTGQVTFWKDGSTITGDPSFMWDGIFKTLRVRGFTFLRDGGDGVDEIQSTSEIRLRPGSSVTAPRATRFINLFGDVFVAGNGNTDTDRPALVVQGGIRFYNTGQKPLCVNVFDSAKNNYGLLWFSQGLKQDSLEVCARDANGQAGWRPLYGPGSGPGGVGGGF